MNKAIIDSLTIEQKLSVITLKSNLSEIITLNEGQIISLVKDFDLQGCLNQNDNKLSANVFFAFLNHLYLHVGAQKDSNNPLLTIEPIKLEDVLETLKSNSNIYCTNNTSELFSTLINSVENNEINIEIINSKVDSVLSAIIPIIKKLISELSSKEEKDNRDENKNTEVKEEIKEEKPKVEKVSKEKKVKEDKPVKEKKVKEAKEDIVVNNVSKRKPIDKTMRTSFVSKGLKRVIIAVLFIYYNIAMFFTYKYQVSDEYENMILIVWLVIALILVIAFLSTFKFTKPKPDNYEKMIDEFTVYTPVSDNKKEVKKSIFKTSVDLKENCSNFNAFLISKGLLVDQKKLRELFSSLASSRMIFINNEHQENNVKFLTALNDYLGNEVYIDVINDNVNSENDLMWKNGSTTQSSNFAMAICDASKHTNNINVACLTNVNVANCMSYLSCIASYIKNPNDKGYIRIDDATSTHIGNYLTNGKLPIPKNVWFIACTNNEENKLPNDFVEDAIMLNIEIKDVQPQETQVEHEYLSYISFSDTISIAREDNFISDDLWAKLDEFEEEMNKQFGYSIENKIIRKMESYASVYNICGDNEMETLDTMLANVLIPHVFSFTWAKEESFYKNILQILIEVFEEGNITRTKEVMNNYK